MDKARYPALEGVIHLDASSAFPLHEKVIADVTATMSELLGAPGKAAYPAAEQANRILKDARKSVAHFLGATEDEIFFIASATDAARLLGDMWCKEATVLYSPEDHSRIIHEIVSRAAAPQTIDYADDGEYRYVGLLESTPNVALVSHIHHIYGSENHIEEIRRLLPNTKLILDASQSVSRMPLDVAALGIDALFFSAQKLGGLAGIGVLYINKKHLGSIDRTYIEPNTVPLIPLVSLTAAMSVLEAKGRQEISVYLARLTAKTIDALHELPGVTFTKGPGAVDYKCYGTGIISFAIDGYSSHDIAMVLADHGINARAGDHCVDPAAASQDVVRISMHAYTAEEDIEHLIEVLKQL